MQLEEENDKSCYLTAFENLFNFEEQEEDMLALEKCLLEVTSDLKKFSDKEKICNVRKHLINCCFSTCISFEDIVNLLQTFLQNDSEISADLCEQVFNVKHCIKYMIKQRENMLSQIIEVLNDATETVNIYIKQLQYDLLPNMDMNEFCCPEYNLSEEDSEDLLNTTIRKMLDEALK